jgi:hypothetical protein
MENHPCIEVFPMKPPFIRDCPKGVPEIFSHSKLRLTSGTPKISHRYEE